MKKLRKLEVISLLFVVLTFLFAFAFYPDMPDYMASHWDAQGVVNGYMPKACALFLLPVLSLVVFLLFMFFSRADPMNENIKKFIQHYDLLSTVVTAFIFYIFVLILAWNKGFRFDFVVFLVPALSILFYFLGVVVSKSKRNYTMGIRTPWTLQSDKVWDETHRIGGRLFKMCAIISLFGVLLPIMAVWLLLAPLLFTIIFIVFYSYHVYKKVELKSRVLRYVPIPAKPAARRVKKTVKKKR
ncbi:SdpI family protein [Candidatus Woesearchaeota archaeon]|nr:SdpI family protein [Candidatus Woesearchaeota archaeon]